MSTEAPLTLEQRLDRLKLTKYHAFVYAFQGIGQLFDGYTLQILIVSFLFMLPSLHLSMAYAGYISTFNNIGLLIGALIWGNVADYIGRKDAFLLTILIYAIGSIFTVMSYNLPALLASRVITGFGLGGEVPLVYSVISEWTPKRFRGIVQGIFGWMFGIGILLASIYATYLLPLYGWRFGFILPIIPAIIVLILRFWTPESPRWLVDKGRTEEAEKLVEDMEKRCKIPIPSEKLAYKPPEKLKVRIAELFSKKYRRTTVALWISAFLSYWGTWGLLMILTTVLSTQLGFTVKEAETLTLIFTLAMDIFGVFNGVFLDTLGRRIWLIVILLISGATVLFLPFGAHNYTLMAILLIIGMGITGEQVIPVFQIYSSELYDTDVRATGVGTASALTRAGMAVAPTVGATLLIMHVPLNIFFASFAIPILIAIPFVFFLKETKKKNLEEITRTKEELEKTMKV